MCGDYDLDDWTYSSEVFVNTSITYAANEAERRVKALQHEGFDATLVATCALGGLLRGFAVYYKPKGE